MSTEDTRRDEPSRRPSKAMTVFVGSIVLLAAITLGLGLVLVFSQFSARRTPAAPTSVAPVP